MLIKLHDEALDYEHNILKNVEMLSDIRVKMYNHGDKEILKELRPVLNTILHDTERYIDWLKEKGV